MQRVSFTLPEKLAVRFFAVVAKGDRSKFVADAIAETLNKEEKMRTFQALANFEPFDGAEESSGVLRKIRASRQAYIVKKGS